jgi:hypothetical protein
MLGCGGIHPTLAIKRSEDLQVVNSVVEVRNDLFNLCGAVGGDLGGNLGHHAGSPELNAIIFDFHADYISRRQSGRQGQTLRS